MGDPYVEEQEEKSQNQWEQQVEAMWSSAKERHGDTLQLRTKRSALWLWVPLHWCLRIVTLGRSIDLIDGNYYCLLGRTIWIPGDGSSHDSRAPHLRLSILSHELDHLDYVYFQDRHARHKDPSTLQTTSPWFRLLHHIKYLLWPLPFWFARYREQIEVWGHERNLKQHMLLNDGTCAKWYRKWLVMQFSSATYAWICTQTRAFTIVDDMIARLEQEFQDKTKSSTPDP